MEQKKSKLKKAKKMVRAVSSGIAPILATFNNTIVTITDKEGNTIWLVQPNPEKAFLMLQAVMEYHLPKLARQEVVGDEQAPQRMVISWKRPE